MKCPYRTTVTRRIRYQGQDIATVIEDTEELAEGCGLECPCYSRNNRKSSCLKVEKELEVPKSSNTFDKAYTYCCPECGSLFMTDQIPPFFCECGNLLTFESNINEDTVKYLQKLRKKSRKKYLLRLKNK